MPDYIDGFTGSDNTTYDFVSKTGRGLVRAIMSNTSTAAAFVVEADGIGSLYDGLTIVVKNTVIASATNCTMNLNDLGAKRIWLSQSNSYCTTHWSLNNTFIFIFDETNDRWELQQGRDTNSTNTDAIYSPYARYMCAGNGIKKYSLYASIGCDQYSSFTTNSGTGAKTFDTNTEFDFSKIYYAYRSADTAAGTQMTVNTVHAWCRADIDLRYTFSGVTTTDSTSSVVSNKPVYLVFTPTHGNFGKITSPYFIQDIATEGEDGKVYVLIGWTRDCYRCDLTVVNIAYFCLDSQLGIIIPYSEQLLDYKMNYTNPTGEGSLSINRVLGSTIGEYSTAVGFFNTASGLGSTAEGCRTKALGDYSHSDGCDTIAYGTSSHAEGELTLAGIYPDTSVYGISAQCCFCGAWNIDNNYSKGNIVYYSQTGTYYIANSNIISSQQLVPGVSGKWSVFDSTQYTIGTSYNHVEGYKSVASGQGSHAEGYMCQGYGNYSHAEGSLSIAQGNYSHAEGYATKANNSYSHSEGYGTTASGDYSHVEGNGSTVSGSNSHAEGGNNTVSGNYSHSEGRNNTVSTDTSHAEGWNNTVSGICSHAEGRSTTPGAQCSHTEGRNTSVSSGANQSHAEGHYTSVTAGIGAHVEGYGSSAYKITASANGAHAEGSYDDTSNANQAGPTASGQGSHAEGFGPNTASGKGSHAEGTGTKASGDYQHVSGKYNIEDTNNTYTEIIGNGTGDSNRSNARTLDWSGNETLAGGLYLGNNIHFDHCTTPVSPSAYPVTMPEPGIMWKEEGYGDKFEIKPRFYGNDDQNMLLFNAANGAAGTDPNVETIAKLHAKTAGVDLIGTVPVINISTNTTDLTQADNGVSSNTYVGTYYQDANGKIMAKITGVAYTDGKTGIELYAKNYNTSGTDQGNNTLTLYTDKSGNKTVGVTAPQAWLDALTRTTPSTVAPNVFNIIGRDGVSENNVRWFFINCNSSLNGFKLVIELPANNWCKYRIETIGTANFGLFHNELYVGTNGSAAIDQCGYRDLNGTFTTVSGCSAVPTTYLTWTADKSNRKLTSNMIPKYGMCMVMVQSSTAITNLVKITTVESN